jgi:amino acid transporter
VATNIKENGNGGVTSIAREAKKLKRELTLIPLSGLIYFTVCGGSFGIEPLVGYSGPGLALLLIFLTPVIFSIPNMLMVRELQSMMPVQGGYYHWVKRAFGPFAGFMAGWNNWVVSWLDVSIYPVFAALYLTYWFDALEIGMTIGSITISPNFLQWIVALIMIWLIAWLQVRGARITGIFTNVMGVIMIIPLAIMAVIGFVNWARFGAPVLPFLPAGEEINFNSMIAALSTGLFVVMWNYMGWELPAAAGDEVVNPKKTYPRAMAIVLVLAIATYSFPVLAGLNGGAGADGRYLLWGIEASDEDAGIAGDLADYDVSISQIEEWGADPLAATGWEFPQIGHAIGEAFSGETNSSMALFLGSILSISAVLSMTGLFIGNSLGGSRVPFALAEDGMMPRWMVKVHPRYGSPYVAILFVSVIYTIFATNAFEFLVVADVFMQLLVILAEFAALWVLRYKEPDRPRNKVPWGITGLVLVTLGPTAVILLAIYSQIIEAGFSSIGWALALMLLGVILYVPFRRMLKPGVPDVDPFQAPPEED